MHIWNSDISFAKHEISLSSESQFDSVPRKMMLQRLVFYTRFLNSRRNQMIDLKMASSVIMQFSAN